jgi:hypothetical protein
VLLRVPMLIRSKAKSIRPEDSCVSGTHLSFVRDGSEQWED